MFFNVAVQHIDGSHHTHQIDARSLPEAIALFSEAMSKNTYGTPSTIKYAEVYFADYNAVGVLVDSLSIMVDFMGRKADTSVIAFFDWLACNAPEHPLVRWWNELHRGDPQVTFKHVLFRYKTRNIFDI